MKKLCLLLVVLFCTNLVKSQTCVTCSVNITGLDTLAYTVSTGQTFCVDKNGSFIGTIILNGGTVCVSGFFNPKTITLDSGVLNNYGTISIGTSINLSSSILLTNNASGIMNVNGSVTLNSAVLSNSGIININQNMNNSGSITNTSIINCTTLTGTGTLNDTGIINSN